MLRSGSKNSIDESKGEELQEGNNGSAIGDAIKVCHMRYQGMSHTLSRYVTYAIKVCHIRYQGMSHTDTTTSDGIIEEDKIGI